MARRLLTIAVAIVLVLAAVAWWLYPANRVMRTLRGIDLPGGYHVAHTERAHGALCFDYCPEGTRFWVTDASPEVAADAVTKALADDGWHVTLTPCPHSLGCTHVGNGPYAVETMTASGRTQREDYTVNVIVGRRGDGRTGIEVAVSGGI